MRRGCTVGSGVVWPGPSMRTTRIMRIPTDTNHVLVVGRADGNKLEVKKE